MWPDRVVGVFGAGSASSGVPVGGVVSQLRSKRSILDVMRRAGMIDRVSEAEHRLPDPVDLDTDSDLSLRLGLSIGSLVDRLGGGTMVTALS